MTALSSLEVVGEHPLTLSQDFLTQTKRSEVETRLPGFAMRPIG